MSGNLALPIYDENPLYLTMQARSEVAELAGTLEARKSADKAIEKATKKEYLQFKTKTGNPYYLTEAVADKYKINLADWKTFFPCLKQDMSDSSNDIFCDIPALLDKLDLPEESDKKKDGIISRAELLTAYKNRETPGYREIIAGFRAMMVQHPLEFDKSLYVGDGIKDKLKSHWMAYDDDSVAILKEEAKQYDIWNTIKDCEGLSGCQNNLWFANPVYFLRHIDKMDCFEFNPYDIGQPIITRPRSGGPGLTLPKVENNPGFAPFVGGGKYSGYAEPSGLFNEDYRHVHPDYTTYFHEGVDFSAPKGTPIHSFISGKVMICGTNWKTHGKLPKGPGGMGDFMLIQDAKDKYLYYLLVHLGRDSWTKYGIAEGNSIVPRQTVAEVWHADSDENTGKANYHLHVSVIRVDKIYEDRYMIINSNIIIDPNFTFPIWDRPAFMHNPFKHTESWKGRNK